MAHSYGVKASQVVGLSSMSGQRWPVLGKKLADGYPFIEAEVIYSARNVRKGSFGLFVIFCVIITNKNARIQIFKM